MTVEQHKQLLPKLQKHCSLAASSLESRQMSQSHNGDRPKLQHSIPRPQPARIEQNGSKCVQNVDAGLARKVFFPTCVGVKDDKAQTDVLSKRRLARPSGFIEQPCYRQYA